MKKRKMYQKIQTLKRQGYSKSEITRTLDIDPKTTARYYPMSEEEFQVYLESQMFREKDFREYERAILEVYEKNGNRRLNMAAVYDYLEERYGILPGNEQTLRNFIRYLTDSSKLQFQESTRIYQKVPELPFGKQMQLDFGQYQMDSGLVLYIFAALLSASRYHYLIFQDHSFPPERSLSISCAVLTISEAFQRSWSSIRIVSWSSVKMPGISSIHPGFPVFYPGTGSQHVCLPQVRPPEQGQGGKPD